MTTNAPRLTDDLLRRSLAELAAGPDSDMLFSDVMRSVDAGAQVRRRPWDTRGWSRALALAAAIAMLVAATIGATVVLTRPQPSPSPLPSRSPLPLSNELVSVPDFFNPFSYRVPEGMSGRLAVNYTPDSVYAITSKPSGSGTLIVFPVTGQLHVYPLSDGTTEGCRSVESELTSPDEVSAFLAGLDEGPVSQTVLGEQPASAISLDPTHSDCRKAVFHIHGLIAPQLEPSLGLNYPGRLIVAATGAGAVGVLDYAPTQAALAEWQPVADALVKGFIFDAPHPSDRVFSVSDFVVPFTYRLPVGLPGPHLKAAGSGEKLYFFDAQQVGVSGRLTLFPVSGFAHGCGADSSAGVPRPAAFLEALRRQFGAGIRSIGTTTLGNLSAYGADVDPAQATCSTVGLHLDGLGLRYSQYEPNLNAPGRLVLAEVPVTPIGTAPQRNRQTIGVLISAPTEDALSKFLPIAQAYVDGLVFDAGQ